MIYPLEGLPIAYDLVPANTDERQAIESVVELVHTFSIQFNSH